MLRQAPTRVRHRSVPPSSAATWAGLATLYLGWGSGFPAMRIALRTIPPILLIGVRCLLGALLLLAVARARGTPVRVTPRSLGSAAMVGLLTLGLGHGLVAYGVRDVPAGLAAVLVSMSAVWMSVLGWPVLRERPTHRAFSGLLVASGGLTIVVWSGIQGTARFGAIIALIVAPVSWAIGSVLSRRLDMPQEPLVSTSLQMVAAGPVVLVASALLGEFDGLDLATIPMSGWLAFGYLTIVGYALVFSVYTWMLRVAPLSTVGTYSYINPLVAVVLGVMLLGEPLTGPMVVGGSLLLFGVARVVLTEERTLPVAHAPVPTRVPDEVPL